MFGFDNHLRHSWLERVDDGYVAVDGERHEGEDGHGHREEGDEVVHRAVPSPERPVPGGVRKKGYESILRLTVAMVTPSYLNFVFLFLVINVPWQTLLSVFCYRYRI